MGQNDRYNDWAGVSENVFYLVLAVEVMCHLPILTGVTLIMRENIAGLRISLSSPNIQPHLILID